MLQSAEQRKEKLERLQALLNTENGLVLMAEIRVMWDCPTLLGEGIHDTAYNVGLRDAYKYIEMLQTGEMIHG